MTYSFKNPVKVPLYIELEAMGSSFPFVVPGGRTVTKRVKFPKGCEGRQTTSSPRIARGRVIFRCSSFFNIAFAAPVEQELKSYSDLPTTKDTKTLTAAIQKFPKSPLLPLVFEALGKRNLFELL